LKSDIVREGGAQKKERTNKSRGGRWKGQGLMWVDGPAKGEETLSKGGGGEGIDDSERGMGKSKVQNRERPSLSPGDQ